MKTSFPAKIYPHISQLVKLGADETHEGRLYTAKYQNEIWKEYNEFMDSRRSVGGNDGAHKITKHEHT